MKSSAPSMLGVVITEEETARFLGCYHPIQALPQETHRTLNPSTTKPDDQLHTPSVVDLKHTALLTW